MTILLTRLKKFQCILCDRNGVWQLHIFFILFFLCKLCTSPNMGVRGLHHGTIFYSILGKRSLYKYINVSNLMFLILTIAQCLHFAYTFKTRYQSMKGETGAF